MEGDPATLIDFVRRNDDFTFIYSLRARPFPPFNGGNGGPYSARGNQFAKRNVAVFGPGELIRQGNFYGMTAQIVGQRGVGLCDNQKTISTFCDILTKVSG